MYNQSQSKPGKRVWQTETIPVRTTYYCTMQIIKEPFLSVYLASYDLLFKATIMYIHVPACILLLSQYTVKIRFLAVSTVMRTYGTCFSIARLFFFGIYNLRDMRMHIYVPLVMNRLSKLSFCQEGIMFETYAVRKKSGEVEKRGQRLGKIYEKRDEGIQHTIQEEEEALLMGCTIVVCCLTRGESGSGHFFRLVCSLLVALAGFFEGYHSI